ncbi:ECF subfamily RNA polymerase sigma-70 factor [Ignavibacterium album JCM 16511]|uniref:RNA polymerase sigma factor n=1 Tax=Ignavibacterium album (strain DSM 19864 / JCM 16511 / NBRC 101810 / Mat9-16) TaxID=945713 RepID=I0ALY3_IGNAJ|nr:sigma-70 family RNA polymerase sigma factor [Ignavibacterium album]AFH49990.1 ECF subfamily RNA polymerase sigma-70 factor [Ignavibacterium album JCM 16511]
MFFPFIFNFAIVVPDENQRQLYEDFEREAVPHMDALYNFALKMTGDSDEADDLVQETFLKAFRFFDKFEKGTNCKAWLFRIMKNTYINKYRKETKEPDKVDYEEVENFYENVKPSSTDSAHLEKDIYDNLLDDELSEAINSLPEDFKTVVILCDIEGFTYEEIADFIDVPVGTVRSRLHRARKMLFTKLQKYAAERGYISKDEK